MNTPVFSLLEAALTCIVHASWQAAVLGLSVLAVCRLLGTSLQPRWRFALWLVVFARLALPIAPSSPWSLFQIPQLMRAEPAIEPPATESLPYREIQPITDSPAQPMPSLASPAGEPPAHDLEVERPTGEATEPSLSAGACLALIWFAGILLLVGRRSWLAIRLARQKRSWRQVSEPRILQVFKECRQELRLVWPVELLVAPGLTGPATGGVWRPYIVLPEKLISSFSGEEHRLLLLHELLHVRRLDVFSDRLAALVAIVHWFNPIAWLALGCMRRERELACDAAVLDRVDAEGAGHYGRLLLKSVEQLRTATPLSGAVEMFGPDLSLIRRIHMIANHHKPTRARRVLGSLLVLLLIAFGLTDAPSATRIPEEKNKGSNPSQPAAEKTILLAGICQDEQGAALKDVRVTVYREDFRQLKTERLREGMTNDRGEFRFTDLPAFPQREERREWTYVLTYTKKGRGSGIQWISYETPTDKLTISMKLAATLQGRVTDPSGKPIAGAWVWTNGLSTDPLPGVCSSRTDAEGRYAITDLPAWDVATQKPQVSADGRSSTMISHCYLYVRHPDYGEQRPMYKRVPDTINITLQPAGILEGRVLDQLTGKPAADVLVRMQSTNKSKAIGFHQTRTDRDGKYRFSSLPDATFNIWAEAPKRACAAIDSFTVTAGKTQTAPDLKLMEGGWIEGHLIDAESSKPISRGSQGQRLFVAAYGPSRPKSGAACQSSEVDDRGAFRLHVAPGISFPYIMSPDVWNRTQRREYYEKGIEVKSGEIVSLVFRILPKEPLADPDPTPVRLRLPVAAERQAAQSIRELGGWYEVDKDNHVIEVNMASHETPGKVYYSNKRTDTDEGLRAVKAFPHLKRLFLCKGQASDEALVTVADLNDLEMLFIRDADKITDAGMKHLAGLTKLQNISISNSQMGDGALEVFARLPALKHLGLQGNAFSDEGLRHLEGMKQLRSLWIGMNRKPITDAGIQHLAGLTMLEQLDLQRSSLSDEGIAALRNLKNLRHLDISIGRGTGDKQITDAGVDTLTALTNLQALMLLSPHITNSGAKRLSELPKIKTLWLPTSFSEQEREELKKRRPNLKVYFGS